MTREDWTKHCIIGAIIDETSIDTVKLRRAKEKWTELFYKLDEQMNRDDFIALESAFNEYLVLEQEFQFEMGSICG